LAKGQIQVKTQHKRSYILATILGAVTFFIMGFSVSAQDALPRAAPSFKGETIRTLSDSDPDVPKAVQVPRARRAAGGIDAIQLSGARAVTTSSYYWYRPVTIVSARRSRLRHVYLISPEPPARHSVEKWWCCLYLGVAY
jgi:hypothetical protein